MEALQTHQKEKKKPLQYAKYQQKVWNWNYVQFKITVSWKLGMHSYEALKSRYVNVKAMQFCISFFGSNEPQVIYWHKLSSNGQWDMYQWNQVCTWHYCRVVNLYFLFLRAKLPLPPLPPKKTKTKQLQIWMNLIALISKNYYYSLLLMQNTVHMIKLYL